jgi:Holliday junction resolvase
MVRTLEGGECHQRLMELSAEFLRNQGYKVVFQGSINKGKIDVIGIKGEEKVGIECQVKPSWKILVDKAKRYSGLTRFIVAIPKDVKVGMRPEGVEIMKLNVSKPKPKSKLVITLPDELEQKFRESVKTRLGEGKGALSLAAAKAIDKWIQGEK